MNKEKWHITSAWFSIAQNYFIPKFKLDHCNKILQFCKIQNVGVQELSKKN